ncbi:Chromatin structure-remodeling complex protein RSC14 [Nakaseomyces bracarensis]|uniref:Chromatin structure-remodeling complex protein RSC14 n=1 Tax=Nakaseomyces bracarensis TaxID=273131 RepID=A0ABR4NTH9_9SACH
MIEKKLDYYGALAGLASLDRSHQVNFSDGELVELVKNRRENLEPQSEDLYRNNKNRINIHGSLGGKVDMKEITEMTYDLDHNLLGGYVPRQQLETLSSADFARYFHKKIECGNSLRAYDTFLADTHFGLMAKPQKKSSEAQPNNATATDSAATVATTTATTTTTPTNTSESTVAAKVATPTSSHVRKVVVCKRCRARFIGPSRMKSLRRHNCKQ